MSFSMNCLTDCPDWYVIGHVDYWTAWVSQRHYQGNFPSCEEEKQVFASVPPTLQLSSITFEQALNLFKLPKDLGVFEGEDVLVNNGRFGPYVKFGKKFISLPKGVDPLSVEMDEAIELNKEKEKADAPIHEYEGLPVQKGKGRFGPFIKWNNMFINVNKKYDWDNLSIDEIEELIEDKKQKEIEKVVHNWEEEGIKVEKGRWGKFYLIKSKKKICMFCLTK